MCLDLCNKTKCDWQPEKGTDGPISGELSPEALKHWETLSGGIQIMEALNTTPGVLISRQSLPEKVLESLNCIQFPSSGEKTGNKSCVMKLVLSKLSND